MNRAESRGNPESAGPPEATGGDERPAVAGSPDPAVQRTTADRLLSHGLRLLAVEAGGKKPLLRGWQHGCDDPGTIAGWIARGLNLGVVCDRVAVVDTDTRGAAVWWWRTMPRTPWMTRTPRGGVHFYYAGDDSLRNAQGERFDIRAGGRGFTNLPGSHAGGLYELVGEIVPPDELPPFDPDWYALAGGGAVGRAVAATRGPLRELVAADEDLFRRIERARAYVATLPPSVSGERGHDTLMRCAGVLVQKFSLGVAEAFPLICEYNDRARPPWPRRELVRKLREAERLKHP